MATGTRFGDGQSQGYPDHGGWIDFGAFRSRFTHDLIDRRMQVRFGLHLNPTRRRRLLPVQRVEVDYLRIQVPQHRREELRRLRAGMLGNSVGYRKVSLISTRYPIPGGD